MTNEEVSALAERLAAAVERSESAAKRYQAAERMVRVSVVIQAAIVLLMLGRLLGSL